MSGLQNAFEPIKLGNLKLQNRIALAAMTRLRCTKKHVPLPLVADYYEQRSRTPGSFLVTEATLIQHAAGGYQLSPGIWTEEQIANWKPVFDKVHKNGSYAFLQLAAIGRQADLTSIKEEHIDYVAPSPVRLTRDIFNTELKDHPIPRELTHAEIKQNVEWFATAAKNAIAAGADGVELHGANGYLIDQFLHPNTNTRTDEYGGSIVNRARFPLEVLDAVIDAIGAERVAIRLSPWGATQDLAVDISPVPQWSYLVAEIERRGIEGKRIAYISTVEGRLDPGQSLLPKWVPKSVFALNDFVGLVWTGPWVRAGDLVNNVSLADQDDRTLIAIGRQFVSNPDLVDRLRAGLPLTPYDRSTFYYHEALESPSMGYTDYPFYSETVEAQHAQA